jgi:hypothetical protein
VWSGTQLYSRRLASIQLWLVAVGLVGFAGALLSGWLAVTPLFGGLLLLGFWVFVYNVGRTLESLAAWDVTERHFALALGFFVLVTGLGLVLALDFVHPVLDRIQVSRLAVVQAHATLAVFGAILTTVFGALYQLGTMFTQTELHGIDVPIRRFETVTYPVGVLALAMGRLADVRALAMVGGLLVVASLAGVSVVLARRLWETQVPWTPMLSRYAVFAFTAALWSLLTLPVWLRDPLSARALLGAPGTSHLLVIGLDRTYIGHHENDFVKFFVPEALRLLEGEPLQSRWHPPLYAIVLAGAYRLCGEWLTAGLLLSLGSSALALAATAVVAGAGMLAGRGLALDEPAATPNYFDTHTSLTGSHWGYYHAQVERGRFLAVPRT